MTTDDDGVVVLGGPAEAYVLRTCRYYHTLNEVFGQDEDKGVRHRRTYQQKRTKSESIGNQQRKLLLDDVNVQEPEVQSEVLVLEKKRMQVSEGESAPMTSATLVSIAPTSNTVGDTAPHAAIPASGLTGSWTNPVVLKSTQRMLAGAVCEELERKRFRMEEGRNTLQCEKLRCEVEAAKLQLTIDRALSRKKLLDAGLSEAQVNDLLST